MCQFIETIRVVDGQAMYLPYHQARVNSTLNLDRQVICLEELLDSMIKTYNRTNGDNDSTSDKRQIMAGIYKARFIYDSDGNISDSSISPYTMRNIQTLQLVECGDIDYSLKYADRSKLNTLAAQANGADEIIIVRNGLLTDTSYSNIALFDGIDWHTPSTPLLQGTMRKRLLDNGRLKEADITISKLKNYQKICLINAMMPLGACCIDIRNSISGQLVF